MVKVGKEKTIIIIIARTALFLAQPDPNVLAQNHKFKELSINSSVLFCQKYDGGVDVFML